MGSMRSSVDSATLSAWRGQLAATGIPVKVGTFRNFGGFAEIEACKGMSHSSGEPRSERDDVRRMF